MLGGPRPQLPPLCGASWTFLSLNWRFWRGAYGAVIIRGDFLAVSGEDRGESPPSSMVPTNVLPQGWAPQHQCPPCAPPSIRVPGDCLMPSSCSQNRYGAFWDGGAWAGAAPRALSTCSLFLIKASPAVPRLSSVSSGPSPAGMVNTHPRGYLAGQSLPAPGQSPSLGSRSLLLMHLGLVPLAQAAGQGQAGPLQRVVGGRYQARSDSAAPYLLLEPFRGPGSQLAALIAAQVMQMDWPKHRHGDLVSGGPVGTWAGGCRAPG